MRLEDEEAYGHRCICLIELRMVSGEKLRKGDEVAERLAHLLSLDGDHVVVHPILDSAASA